MPTCDICGKELKSLNGLSGHKQWIHEGKRGGGVKAALANQEASWQAVVSELESRIQELEKTAGELNQLNESLKSTKQAREAAEGKAKELSELQELPGVRDFLKHCESGECQQHKQEWQAVKTELVQRTLDNLPPEVVKAKAEALGLIPHTFIIRDVERILAELLRKEKENS